MKNIAEIPPDLHAFIEVLTGDINTTVTIQTFSDKRGSGVPAKVLHGTVSSLFPKLSSDAQSQSSYRFQQNHPK